MNLLVKGGWVMIPILAGSVIALTLVLERLWFFWKIRLETVKFAREIFSHAREGRTREAMDLCGQTAHPMGAVLKVGLEHAHEPPEEVERMMEREGNRQIQRVEKNLNFLALVIGVEPLLGFLGTILGLIGAFMAWERYSTSVTVSTLAAGIYQAMITTAAGLIVAIPYYVVYHIFLGKAGAIAQDLNHYGDELVSVLQAARRSDK